MLRRSYTQYESHRPEEFTDLCSGNHQKVLGKHSLFHLKHRHSKQIPVLALAQKTDLTKRPKLERIDDDTYRLSNLNIEKPITRSAVKRARDALSKQSRAVQSESSDLGLRNRAPSKVSPGEVLSGSASHKNFISVNEQQIDRYFSLLGEKSLNVEHHVQPTQHPTQHSCSFSCSTDLIFSYMSPLYPPPQIVMK